jgi:hypothetical protein
MILLLVAVLAFLAGYWHATAEAEAARRVSAEQLHRAGARLTALAQQLDDQREAERLIRETRGGLD